MLIARPDLDAIRANKARVAFRRWRAPRVKAGTLLRTAVGLLHVDAIEEVDPAALTEADAREAGRDLATLQAELAGRKGALYRIRLTWQGADPRLALREDADLSDADRAALTKRLARMDARRRWTDATLRAIADNPGVRAGDLADGLGRERLAFKRDVRKLKELGLTVSLETGYRLSPRGRAWLDGP